MKNLRTHLILIGWLMIVGVIGLSLVPISASIADIKNGDKIGHFIAYFTLMLWFTWLYPKPWVRNLYGIGFILLGGLMELLQSILRYRSMDLNDFHANTVGVVAGFIFAVLLANIPFIKRLFRL